jgi:CheY-like chemotaxis protein
VDDYEDTRDMIVAMLGSGGYEVTTAGGSEDGLAAGTGKWVRPHYPGLQV